MNEEVAVVDKKIVEEERAMIVHRAQNIVIETRDQHIDAVNFLRAIKVAQKRVTELFGTIKKKAHETWKAVCKEEGDALRPLESAESMVKSKVIQFQQAEEEKRLAIERKLQAEADAKARREQEALLKRADSLKTPEKAEALREQAASIVAPTVTVAPRVETQAGTSLKKTWKAKVVDVAQVPREFMVVNQQALDAFARSTKGQVKIAGVEFYEETGMSVSTK